MSRHYEIESDLDLETLYNDVDFPRHYCFGRLECISCIESALTADEYRGFLKGQIIKYVWRERLKGGTESLKKASWYLTQLIKFDEQKTED